MTKHIEIKVTNNQLNEFGLPQFATTGAAGIDVRAMIEEESIVIKAGQQAKVGLGFALHINNPNLVAVLVPRSGLGTKHGIGLANTIGIIDSDYTGEIIAMLKNNGKEDFTLNRGDRIAQILFMHVEQPLFQIVENFSETSERGANGFGSTGVK